MINTFLRIIALLSIISGLLYSTYWVNRILIIPYPYSFTANATKLIKDELPAANSAQILIVGDQMGESLSPYLPALVSELAKNFKSPPQIYNWSKAHEGLHRTLFKLKSLQKFPSIIIYHGASSEMYEKIFNVNDQEAIFSNFVKYDDEKIISLIITFPWLSKILYQKTDYYDLGPLKEYRNQNPGPIKMIEKEVSFKLFDYQINELIDLVKNKKSSLILITTPLNLEVAPHETCSQAMSNSVLEIHHEIEQMIKEGNLKTAYSKLRALSKETYSNATSFYLLGKVSLRLGEIAEAREAFQKATAFDCANWRGNAVYNSIIKSNAKKRQIDLIDFDQYMTSALSNDELFIDDFFPQNIYYKKMMVELLENLKKILQVSN